MCRSSQKRSKGAALGSLHDPSQPLESIINSLTWILPSKHYPFPFLPEFPPIISPTISGILIFPSLQRFFPIFISKEWNNIHLIFRFCLELKWPPDAKNWLLGKDPDAGKDWRQEEKGTTEDEMVGWHHRRDRHEFEQALGVGEGQGSLACCSPWDHRVRHDWATELKNGVLLLILLI